MAQRKHTKKPRVELPDIGREFQALRNSLKASLALIEKHATESLRFLEKAGKQ